MRYSRENDFMGYLKCPSLDWSPGSKDTTRWCVSGVKGWEQVQRKHRVHDSADKTRLTKETKKEPREVYVLHPEGRGCFKRKTIFSHYQTAKNCRVCLVW